MPLYRLAEACPRLVGGKFGTACSTSCGIHCWMLVPPFERATTELSLDRALLINAAEIQRQAVAVSAVGPLM